MDSHFVYLNLFPGGWITRETALVGSGRYITRRHKVTFSNNLLDFLCPVRKSLAMAPNLTFQLIKTFQFHT